MKILIIEQERKYTFLCLNYVKRAVKMELKIKSAKDTIYDILEMF